MKPLMVGEAPARSGDGRPFTGVAGRRLLKLLGFQEYDELTDYFDLDNIFHEPVSKKRGKGDPFDKTVAQMIGSAIRTEARRLGREDAILMGTRVWGAVLPRSPRPDWLGHVEVDGTRYHLFPHPSGVSHYWNDREATRAAAKFLRRIVRAQA